MGVGLWIYSESSYTAVLVPLLDHVHPKFISITRILWLPRCLSDAQVMIRPALIVIKQENQPFSMGTETYMKFDHQETAEQIHMEPHIALEQVNSLPNTGNTWSPIPGRTNLEANLSP